MRKTQLLTLKCSLCTFHSMWQVSNFCKINSTFFSFKIPSKVLQQTEFNLWYTGLQMAINSFSLPLSECRALFLQPLTLKYNMGRVILYVWGLIFKCQFCFLHLVALSTLSILAGFPAFQSVLARGPVI